MAYFSLGLSGNALHAMAFGSVNVHRQTEYLNHTVEAKTNKIGFEVDALYSL